MRSVMADVRYAWRVMMRTPSFALAVVGVLALGIGANTAIFSIVNTVLLRPMPFDDADRLVRIFTRTAPTATAGPAPFAVSAGKFYSWQRDARSFESMALNRSRSFALTGRGTARTITASAVGPGFFDIVRTRPALGRVFLPEEDTQGRHRVAILSDRFWRSELGGAPAILGQSLTLNDEAYTIVGVMPPAASVASFQAMATDIWVPIALGEDARAVRDNHNQRVVARLKPDVSIATAQSEMDVISARLGRAFPQSDGGWGAVVMSLQEEIVGDSRTMLLMLLGAVGLVLLIACANVGNLLFTRALGRRKEVAIRGALGAGRGRVMQQLLIEALLLAAAGGAIGLALAYTILTAAAAMLAGQVPRSDEISIDLPVLGFVAGISMLTGAIAGLLPALRASRSDLNEALKEGGRSDAAIGGATRRMLIVGEVALSLVLLMSAGVLVQSLFALRHSDTGFDPHNVLMASVSLPATRYPTSAQASAFFDAALDRIRALPGVEAAGATDNVPFIGGSNQSLELEGYPPLAPRDQVVLQVRQIRPGYLRSMRIPVLRGRDITDGDADGLLVSQEVARLLWKSDDPIGRRARLPFGITRFQTVVGIVGDVKQRSLAEGTTPTVYYYAPDATFGGLTITVRTSVPPATVAQPLAAVIRGLDPELPVQGLRTMVDVVDSRVRSQRFTALLFGGFAGVALLLASIGIYSVLSYIVRGRRREIGIRTALGARTSDVVRLVIVEGMTPTLIGIAVGIVAALAASTLLKRLVFGVSASDPITLIAVAIALALVALMASVVPAYRASRFDPVKVLRAD